MLRMHQVYWRVTSVRYNYSQQCAIILAILKKITFRCDLYSGKYSYLKYSSFYDSSLFSAYWQAALEVLESHSEMGLTRVQ